MHRNHYVMHCQDYVMQCHYHVMRCRHHVTKYHHCAIQHHYYIIRYHHFMYNALVRYDPEAVDVGQDTEILWMYSAITAELRYNTTP